MTGMAMKLSEVAQRLGCELRGNGETEICGVNGIDEAGPGELTFVANKKDLAKLPALKAAGVILSPDAPEVGLPSLRTANPYLASAQDFELFYPPSVPPTGVLTTS